MEKELNTYNCQLSSVNYQLPSPPPEAHYTVYKLTDPNGKVYIGCTGKTVKARWNNGKNYKRTTLIRKAISEIGWDNFEKTILCEHLTKEGGSKLEKWFIAYYDSANPEKGYNRALGGLGKGVCLSKESREQCRKSKCLLYEKDPDYRERVSRGVLAAYENDPGYRERLSKAMIRTYENNYELMKAKQDFYRKYYQSHSEKREKHSRWMKEYLSKPENRAFVVSDTHAKPVICVETGEYFPSQCAAEKATGYRGIHRVCQGFQNTAGGYHWRYA